MLTLYHAPGSFSTRMLWLLEELQAGYEIALVADAYTPGTEGAPRSPHPHGFTPALRHEGQLVIETGAIALYLTDLHPQSTVGVAQGDPLRGAYLSWLFYQVGVTEPLVYMQGRGSLAQDDGMRHFHAAMMQRIETTLQQGPYLLGERFTAADILFMSLFEHARPLFGEAPWLDAYLARADRPARQRALARAG